MKRKDNKGLKMYVAYLMFALMLVVPVSAMIKDSVYLGADGVIFNTSTFFISQPDAIQYFQSPYEADLTQSDGWYYPIVLSFNNYNSVGGEAGTLNVQVDIYHANLSVESKVVDYNITFVSGQSYSDNEDGLAVGWVMPLDAVAYVKLDRVNGNFTVIKRNAWYKTVTTLNKPNLDAMSNALVDIIVWYKTLLESVVTPILNFFIMLWNYGLVWLIVAEFIVFIIRRAVMLGSNFVPHNIGR